MLKLFLVLLLLVGLGGCATCGKKQATKTSTVNYEKARTYQQEAYQRDYDDDEWSSDTYEKVAAKTYTEQAPQLTPKQIQRALKSAGFYQGSIDGKIGSKTKEAIIKFQKAKSLKADGIVGKRTSAELNKYLSR